MLRFGLLLLAACAVASAQPLNRSSVTQYYQPAPGDQVVYYNLPHPQAYYYEGPPAMETFLNQELRAIVRMRGDSVNGNVTFTQHGENGEVHVEGTIIGLPPGRFGFHVHEKGDITGGCLSSGGHFNPYQATHGGPQDSIRHVGDLGNIVAGADRIARIDIVDKVISLTGEKGIIGRTLVVHSGEDDFGRTDHPDSKKTGNAGSRLSCGVIGILDIPKLRKNAAPAVVTPFVLLGTMLLAAVKIL